MGNQKSISQSAYLKIKQLEKEILVLRECLFGVAGVETPDLKHIELDMKYIAVYSNQSNLMKGLFKTYESNIAERIQRIFLISYQYDIKHECQYLEDYISQK